MACSPLPQPPSTPPGTWPDDQRGYLVPGVEAPSPGPVSRRPGSRGPRRVWGVAKAPLLGLSLYCPPEDIVAQAAVAEEAGFDEIWLGEDFFDTGGITAAALALGATRRVTIGLGVLSAAVRAPALLAMELAALGRAHPGRLIAGIGLGEPAPLGIIGQLPESPPDRPRLGHHQDQPIPLPRAHPPETDAGVAGGRLDDDCRGAAGPREAPPGHLRRLRRLRQTDRAACQRVTPERSTSKTPSTCLASSAVSATESTLILPSSGPGVTGTVSVTTTSLTGDSRRRSYAGGEKMPCVAVT